MKESVVDVLMYLFENYMNDEIELYQDQESLKLELVEAGFAHEEINKAFQWLEGLASLQESPTLFPLLTAQSTRSFTVDEMDKLDVESRGFLLFLEQVGVLDHYSRELVIDRVMALDTEEIDLDTLKWVILMVLFNQPGQEAAFAWMEGLVLDDMSSLLH